MCISVREAEFTNTTVAVWDAAGQRNVSYLNAVNAMGNTRYGIRNSGPNAMLFAIHGTEAKVLACPDPAASREWLGRAASQALYSEYWCGEDVQRGRRSSPDEVTRAGNYDVIIASTPFDLDDAAATLRRQSNNPQNVPKIPRTLQGALHEHYARFQEGVQPQIVLAAFAFEATAGPEKKNPITVQFTPYDVDTVVLPALDAHGTEGLTHFTDYARRQHTILLGCEALEQLLDVAPDAHNTEHPQEFTTAPERFSFAISDRRLGSDFAGNNGFPAPNGDMVFNMGAINDRIITARHAIADMRAAKEPGMRESVTGQAIGAALGGWGLMPHSDQLPLNLSHEEISGSYRLRKIQGQGMVAQQRFWV